MQDSAKNVIIGAFVIIAIGIVVFILMFLHPKVGDNGKTLHVRFTNIDKISKGTRVTFAGKPVGEVVSIEEVPDARIEQSFRKGDVYIYELTLNIDSSVDVYESDQISIRTSGLLGDRAIEITPEPVHEKEFLRPITAQEVIFAASPPSVEETLGNIQNVVGKIGRAFEGISGEINTLKKHKVIARIGKVAENLVDITSAINQPADLSESLKNIHATIAGVRELQESISNSWVQIDNNVQVGVQNFVSASDSLAKIGETGKAIIDKTSRGEGSLGKLLADDEFYLRLNATMHKAEIVADDINHYGLLFHLDKGWQRLRARRANLLQQLSKPQEFRNFFTDEVDNITTSLTRVSMVLQETEQAYGCDRVICTREFRKVFADLLRNVGGLEENLKLYNQQMEDMRCASDAPCATPN